MPKTTLLVAGVGLSPDDVAPLQMSGHAVEIVKELQYLESLVKAAGRMTGKVEYHIVQASKTFESLCNAVFMDHDLNLETKGLVYHSVVLSVLLYDAETWAPIQVLVKKLEWFHHCCIRHIMGVGKTVQWTKHITTAQLAECFHMRVFIGHLLGQCRL